MFGYISINQPEIKFKDYYRFRSYYCGVCSELKSQHGEISRMSLGYDMTFLAVLLSGLYDTDTKTEQFRCIAHPVRKRVRRVNEFSVYCADMNLLLTYYKCMDDWQDEKKWTRLLYAKAISGKVKKVIKKYPEKAENIEKYLKEQSEIEAGGEKDIDSVAGCFGNVLAEIFAYKADMWENKLRKMGFFLGKYIYLLDAFDDIFDDVRKGCYNPFSDIYLEDGFEERVAGILKMMISESADAFEMLPVEENMDILRNVIYSGVWRHFELITMKRHSENDETEINETERKQK